MPDIEPWERQSGESSKAYEAFVTYRDMGADRGLQKVANALGKSMALITRWSGNWSWPERSRAWDSIPARATAEAHGDMARRIAAQHERVATKLLAKLETNIDRLPEGTDPTMRLSTALGAARQSHQFASDLTKPESTAKDAIAKAIEDIVNKLAGE